MYQLRDKLEYFGGRKTYLNSTIFTANFSPAEKAKAIQKLFEYLEVSESTVTNTGTSPNTQNGTPTATNKIKEIKEIGSIDLKKLPAALRNGELGKLAKEVQDIINKNIPRPELNPD